MDSVTSLIIPFVALAILSVMCDKFTLFLQLVMEKMPGLPNQFEKPIAYMIVLAVSYGACWRGDYNLFSYLDFTFQYKEEGWLFTALVVSGGSMFLRESFSAIDNIPVSIGSAYGAVRRVLPSLGTQNSTSAAPPDIEPRSEKGDD